MLKLDIYIGMRIERLGLELRSSGTFGMFVSTACRKKYCLGAGDCKEIELPKDNIG